MGIYLGTIGNIELTRRSFEGSKKSVVNPSDVNYERNRFSFDFAEGTLITGDLIKITATDRSKLDFISASGWGDNERGSVGKWYIHVDELGSIRLYNNFNDSLEGSAAGLIELEQISRDIPIRVQVEDTSGRLLASITDYELNTARETVDITALSDEYRQQYSSLITGSGRLTAQWDYVNEIGQEPIHYLMQLVLRTEIGAGFHAKLYIKTAGATASAGAFAGTQTNDALWWEFDALVTSSATSFAPGDIVVSTIDFVATGPIKLRAETTPRRRLLQEKDPPFQTEDKTGTGTDFLLLESGDV